MTKSRSLAAYQTEWDKLEELTAQINQEAEIKCDLPVTKTAVLARILSKAPAMNLKKYHQFCENKSVGKKIEVKPKSFVLPQRVLDRIDSLVQSVGAETGSYYKVLSYLISNTTITAKNYF